MELIKPVQQRNMHYYPTINVVLENVSSPLVFILHIFFIRNNKFIY